MGSLLRFFQSSWKNARDDSVWPCSFFHKVCKNKSVSDAISTLSFFQSFWNNEILASSPIGDAFQGQMISGFCAGAEPRSLLVYLAGGRAVCKEVREDLSHGSGLENIPS